MIDKNKATIEKFYTSFQQKDYYNMNSLYAENIVFSDPVFGLLQGDEVRAMWQMLCIRAKDFSLVFGEIVTDDEEYYTCEWTASYLFSVTNRRVVNKCKAYMRLKDGVIVEHSDAFSFYKWCRQAFGLVGLLIGFTNYMQRRVSKTAKKNLEAFMLKQ
ncbi:MAG: nuclear transport factor 2 family protein [Chitinophagaceae bacterium]